MRYGFWKFLEGLACVNEKTNYHLRVVIMMEIANGQFKFASIYVWTSGWKTVLNAVYLSKAPASRIYTVYTNVNWSAIQIKANWVILKFEFLECLRLRVMALKEAEFGGFKTQGYWNTADENEVHPRRDKLEKVESCSWEEGR